MLILSSLPLIIVFTLIIWGLNKQYNLSQCFNGVIFYITGFPYLCITWLLLLRKKLTRSFSSKYKHVGDSYPGVPRGWKPIVQQAIIDIEKVMWPRWIPMFIKRWIHYLATGNSVVRVKYRWALNLRSWLTKGQIFYDVK